MKMFEESSVWLWQKYTLDYLIVLDKSLVADAAISPGSLQRAQGLDMVGQWGK